MPQDPARPTAPSATVPLAMVPLFAPLDPDRLHRIVAGSTARTVTAGSVVAVRGEPARSLIVVEAGALTAVHESAGGRRMRLGEFPAPCAVDKTAVLDAGGYTATWLAATRARLRLVPGEVLFGLVDDVPAIRRHVLAQLAKQVRERQDDLVRGSFQSAKARIAGWLLHAAHSTGTRVVSADGAAGIRVVLPGAQQGLAETLGITRVSVNRALRVLARDGLLSVEPGAVVVLAPELLACRASPDRMTPSPGRR